MSNDWKPLLDKAGIKTPKANKYKAVRTSCGKHSHASRGESECCAFFQLLERAGELEILDSQPNVFVTKARVRIIPDWKLRYKDGREVFADYKGHDAPSWQKNRKLWKFYGPMPLEVWRGKNGRFWVSETITGAGPEGTED